MQIRPPTTYDLSDKSRICLLDLRDSPNCEFEAIRQHVRNMKSYMLTVQYNDDNSNDDSIRALCEQQANQGGYFLLNLRNVQRHRIRLGTPVWVFAPICLDSSDRFLKLERISIFTSILRNEMRKLKWNPPSHDSSGLVRRDGGTVLSFTTKKAEQINQELQKKLCQTFQTEAAIDFACDQARVLREHFPQTARSHREEILTS